MRGMRRARLRVRCLAVASLHVTSGEPAGGRFGNPAERAGHLLLARHDLYAMRLGLVMQTGLRLVRQVAHRRTAHSYVTPEDSTVFRLAEMQGNAEGVQGIDPVRQGALGALKEAQEAREEAKRFLTADWQSIKQDYERVRQFQDQRSRDKEAIREEAARDLI